MSNELEKAIRYFKNMRDEKKVGIDSGFGMKKGESNLLYKNRKKYAELAIESLEKQIAKKVTHEATIQKCHTCPNCKNVLDRFDKTLYCWFCGQKIDWNEVE